MSVRTSPLRNVFRRILVTSTLLLIAMPMAGCDLTRNQLKHDREGDMQFQDYRDALAPRISDQAEEELGPDGMPVSQALAMTEDGGIPSLQSYVAPPSEDLRPMPLVSISVNQTVPLRDALFELAEQAGYDVELDPRIRGSVIFTARNRPFDVVVQRLAEIAGLRYKFEDGVLRVELDEPYNKTYKIDYLAYVRKNAGSISNNVSVVSGEGADTGSSFEATTESTADFWGELEANLTQILGVREGTGNLKTDVNPQITAAAQNPAPVEPVVVQGEDGQSTVQVQPPQAVLQVNSLPTETSGRNNEKDESAAPVSSFSINRQAGIISVYATQRQQKEIQEYLKMLKRSVSAQVLIEAKVLEVTLRDEYSAGIDWNAILNNKIAFGLDLVGASLNPALDPVPIPSGDFTAVLNTNKVDAAIEAISRYGTVKSLSNPRLTVLNNQSAVLNVSQNAVYFEIEIESSSDGVTNTVTVDSQIRNVPEGVLINVQPSIDLDRQRVDMAVRPTITRIVDEQPDPGTTFAAAIAGVANVESNIPVVAVQEVDSVISMNSGEAVIMGGLMQDRIESEDMGVPILSEIPLLGSAFKTHGDDISKTELVIFLKATIVDNSNVHETDKDLYKMFSGDRRPLDL